MSHTNMIKHASHLDTVQGCATTCEHSLTVLPQKHDFAHRTTQFQLLRDCADICHLLAKYIARNSLLSKTLSEYCAYVCELCAKTCLQFTDAESQHCGYVCLNCAKLCKDFASQTY